MDTSSLMTPEQVSAIASAIDVPVYVMTVVSPSATEDLPLQGGEGDAARIADASGPAATCS